MDDDNDDVIVLRYVGDGAFVFGVPASDLTQAAVDACGLTIDELLAFEPRVYARIHAHVGAMNSDEMDGE